MEANAYPSIHTQLPIQLGLMIYSHISSQKYSKTHVLMGNDVLSNNIFIVGVEMSQYFKAKWRVSQLPDY